MHNPNHSTNHGLKVVRSRESIPLDINARRSSFGGRESPPFLVSCASAASIADVIPVLEIPPPPNGGWGWVIVFASFMSNFIIGGVIYTFGLFLPLLIDEFDCKVWTISWAGSLMFGIHQIFGPIGGSLVNKYGCRPICMLGGVISTVSLLISYAATQTNSFIVSFGIFGGIGLGMASLSSIVICTYYFEKRRTFTMGISSSGLSIGYLILSPVINFLFTIYNLRGTLLILAGICMHLCVFGALMRPLELLVEEDRNQKKLFIDSQQDLKKRSSDSINESISRNFSSSSNAFHLNLLNEEIVEEPETEDNRFEKCIPPFMVARTDRLEARRQSIAEMRISQNKKTALLRRNQSSPGFGRLSKITGLESPPEIEKEHFIFGINERDHIKLQPSHVGSYLATVRPMARKDIFFGGSIRRLADHNGHDATSIDQALNKYRHSVISIPKVSTRTSHENPLPRGSIVASHLSIRKEAIDPQIRPLEVNKSDSFIRVLKEMTSFKTWENHPKFLVLSIGNFFAYLGIYIPFIYLPFVMHSKSINMERISWIFCIIGAANLIGNILIQTTICFSRISSLLVSNIFYLLGGICIICFSFCDEFLDYVIVSIFTGLFLSGNNFTLTSITIVDILGMDSLTNAYGLTLICRGLSSMFGAPFIIWLIETSGDNNFAFYIAGISLIFSTMISQISYFIDN